MKKRKIILAIIIMMLFITGCSKTEIIKDTITREKEIILDYSSSISFEKALNNKESVNGKKVKLLINKIEENEGKYIASAGDKLCFIFDNSSTVKVNDYIVFKITKEPIIKNDKYQVEYELIKVISNSIEDTNVENEEENNPNQILIEFDSSTYAGKMKDDVEKEFKNKGFKTIKIHEIETNDKNNKSGVITSVSIDGKMFNKGDLFEDDKEVIIYCWKYVEENKFELSSEGVVLPKDGSKLAKDFDYKGTTTIYYMNIDGKTNKPTIKKWGKATVTDSVAEYLDYLKNLGYSIEITEVTNKEPHTGFRTYESKYKVSKGNVNWTMYHYIQDEKYVEYQFDIYLKK